MNHRISLTDENFPAALVAICDVAELARAARASMLDWKRARKDAGKQRVQLPGQPPQPSPDQVLPRLNNQAVMLIMATLNGSGEIVTACGTAEVPTAAGGKAPSLALA